MGLGSVRAIKHDPAEEQSAVRPPLATALPREIAGALALSKLNFRLVIIPLRSNIAINGFHGDFELELFVADDDAATLNPYGELADVFKEQVSEYGEGSRAVTWLLRWV